ncbi:hypothetical protein D3C76_1364330 [compost metagenome]
MSYSIFLPSITPPYTFCVTVCGAPLLTFDTYPLEYALCAFARSNAVPFSTAMMAYSEIYCFAAGSVKLTVMPVAPDVTLTSDTAGTATVSGFSFTFT